MIIGIGSDLTDIRRVEHSLERFGERFVKRCFTDIEQAKSERRKNRAASYAKRFAAKEAFLKAAGTGLREPFSLCEIEAVRLESGAPAYHFSGQTAEWMQAHGLAARLSLSHEGGMALAFCTLETL
mgnify:CR=1 FL=1